MANFTFNGFSVHYEDIGSGEALLLLNGIFMSCDSWIGFIPALSKNNRLLLLDFVDQGKSDKASTDYDISMQADLIEAFLNELGLETVNLAGVSYGGQVAIIFAASRPERVKKLFLANTTSYTSKWLLDIGKSWIYSFESYDSHQFFKTCIPVVYSPKYYESHYEWALEREAAFGLLFTPAIYDAFGRLTRSAECYDERDKLAKITSPSFVVSSTYDFITPPFQQRELAEMIPNAALVNIEDAGHASMYEKPDVFTELLLGFINT